MRRRLEVAALALAVAGTAGAVAGLVSARFARADVYPAGSSLGAGPDGTRALAAALAALPGVAVERAVRPGEESGCGEGCTLVWAGTGTWRPPDAGDLARIDERLRAGARVVLAFAPIRQEAGCGICAGVDEDAAAEDADGGADGEETAAERTRPAPGWWRDLRFEVRESSGDARRAAGAGAELPATLAWNSTLVLAGAPDSGGILYERDGNPVLVETTVGRGVLVVATDDSWLGNRALRDARATAVVLAALGDPRRVLFEETHLGVAAGGGVMVLARRYGLSGAFAGLVALALLFVWRAQSPLAPRIPEAPAEEDEDGRDAAAGLVALLERGLPRAQLVETCLAAWRQSEGVRLPDESWKELEALARTAREPAAGYEAVRAAIAARRS